MRPILFAPMLTLSDVTKSYGERVLFAGAALQVNRGDRIGLVGPNGAGKSTLFSLILGEEPADDGRISRERDATIGYLPQESAPVGDESAFEIAVAITPDFVRVRRQVLAWDTEHPVEAQHPEELHDDAHERYHELNGYQVEARARQILGGLGFRDVDMDRPARELSGGWVMRAHLARLLTQQPDLLMLDEPTNHLDLDSLLWFQDYLRNYPGAILVISHDREFLNHLVSGIVEIRAQKLIGYTGNFDRYLLQREATDAQLLSAYKTQQKEIAHLQAFADRFKAKASKATQAQSKLKQIERMDKIEAPAADDKRVGFRFPQPVRSGQRVLTLKDVHFAYGSTRVYEGIELEVERGERIVLVGPNGAGKSTLLKLLAARLVPQRGERVLGHNVVAGYYSQYRVEMLKPERTVLAEALDTESKVTEQFVRTLLGSFLFSGDAVFKKVEVLSGGEKSRLALVKLLLDPPNLLLMDEPTTHLDMSSIDALVDALAQFEGTLVFISHDVYFIKALANKVVHTAGGRLTHYQGDYEFYLHKTKSTSARAALTAGAVGTGKQVKAGKAAPAQRPAAAIGKQQQRSQKSQVKALQKRVERLEQDIEALESRRSAATEQLEDPSVWQDGALAAELSRDLKATEAKLAEAAQAWESAATELEQLQRQA
ncbi:MAG TPA: ABC-F family ATP-binding cassette domain-containing protein [Planctomycetota bacterium]|nr:ABC-F family ATP-binding cassette domain-containing protein [Planctomycetota bacterium]